jgi:hypothetical protein
VVTDTEEDWAPVPAALTAATVNVYPVEADSPVTVAVAPVIVAVIPPEGSAVVPSYTTYPVTVPDGAVQDKDTLVAELPVTVRPDGAAGGACAVVPETGEDCGPGVPAGLSAATVKL